MTPIVVAEFRTVDADTCGGPDKTIFHSALRHDPRRVRAIPFYLAPHGELPPGIAALRDETGVEPVMVADRAKLDPALPGTMKRLLAEHGCRILHTHDFKTDFWGLALSWAVPGLKLLATAHGWSRPMGWKHRGYNALDFKVLRRYPKVIAVSEHTRRRMIEDGLREERIEVVPNAIDAERWAPRPRAGERPPGIPEGRILGAVGRLSIDKDTETLIDAFSALAARHLDLHLVLVGDGPLRASLEARAGAAGPAAARIHWLGRRSDVRDLYPWFDVFVQSSRTEGMPNTVLEAMATARPIVATPVGGVRELVREGREARFAEPGNRDALAGAVGSLLEDPGAARRLGEEARRRVEDAFSFHARTERMERIYETLLESAAGAQAHAGPVRAGSGPGTESGVRG